MATNPKGLDLEALIVTVGDGPSPDLTPLLEKAGCHLHLLRLTRLQDLETAALDRADLVLVDIPPNANPGGPEVAAAVRAMIDGPVILVTDHSPLEAPGISPEQLPQPSLIRPLRGDQVQLAVDLARLLAHSESRKRQAESQFQEAREKHQNLLETMSQGILYLDHLGRIFQANPAAQAILGRSIEEMRGLTLSDPTWRFVLPDGAPCSPRDLPEQIALKTGAPVHNVVLGFYNPVREAAGWVNINAVPQFKAEEDHSYQVYLTLEDVTAGRQVQEALRESEQKYRTVIENANEGIIVTQNGQVIFFNPQVAQHSGYDPHDLHSSGIATFIHEDDRPAAVDRYLRIMAGEQFPDAHEYRIIDKTGRIRWVRSHSVVVDWVGHKAVLTFMNEITARRLAEDTVKLNQVRLEKLVELSQMVDATVQAIADFALEEAVRLTDSQVGYLFVVNEQESMLTVHAWSKSTAELCRIENRNLVYHLDGTGLWGEAIRRRQPVITNDYQAPSPDKKGYPPGHVDLRRHLNLPVFDEGRIVALAGVANKKAPYDDSDVVQLTLLMDGMWALIRRKKSNDQIAAALAEKEVLLKEIHHRVKNNMQVITSLLNLQAGREQDENILEALGESRDRVQAMALVHEALYRSESLAEIDLGQYITGLTQALTRSYAGRNPGVRVECRIPEHLVLAMDQAVPCGLILNELLSNALKHAFPDQRSGLVTVQASILDDQRLQLVVQDDGLGLPVELNLDNLKTLGLSLVHGLAVSQLGGELEVQRDHGTRFVATFRAK
jgi:PAS domain S-box-containing protein